MSRLRRPDRDLSGISGRSRKILKVVRFLSFNFRAIFIVATVLGDLAIWNRNICEPEALLIVQQLFTVLFIALFNAFYNFLMRSIVCRSQWQTGPQSRLEQAARNSRYGTLN